MWQNKNFRLSLILFILLVITGVVLMRKSPTSRLVINRDLFNVKDTSRIDRLTILINDQEISLNRKASGWMICEEKKADNYYVSLLKTVLYNVEVQRKISISEKEEVNTRLQDTGVKVTVLLSDGTKTSFLAGGNKIQTISYFKDLETDDIYRVNIPGYRSFVSGIFLLTEMEWRDKTLFESSWTSIQTLKVTYPAQPGMDFRIIHKDGFLQISGIEAVDTTKMMDYVALFSSLKANYFFESATYDSLLKTDPFMQIQLMDLDSLKNNEVRVYPLEKGSVTQVGITKDGQVFGFDYRNMEFLARGKRYFIAEYPGGNP